MYTRLVEHRLRETLADTPVALVIGPRRAGKTTLVRAMGEAERDAAGKRFVLGVVLYDSDTIVPFGERLAAAPISCLWN
jgi:predicted AAA+ superfamily ATPase